MFSSKKLIYIFSICFSAIVIVAFLAFKGQKDANHSTSSISVGDLLQRGEKIQMGKEWDEVQNQYASYKNAIKNDVDDNKSKILLAQLYIKEARVTGEHGHYYPSALEVLDDAINNESIDDDLTFLAMTTKAGVQLSLHDFQDALTTGNQAALLNPTNAQIHGVLIDANVEMGNYEKAIALTDRMLTIKPDIRSYSRASYLREIHGDVKGAKQAMNMAVQAGFPGLEETAWAMLTLGEIYQRYGALDTAKMIYESILETRPNYPFAVGAIGDVLMQQGKNQLSEKELKKAMDIIPEVGFYISLAHLYKKENRVNEMNSLVQEIKVMLKEDTDSGHNMNLEFADLYLELLDDPRSALSYAQLEYDKRPKNIDVNLMLAKIYDEIGDKDIAQTYLKQANVTNAKYPELLALNKI
ncbi:MAG: tetratricopeptide repeat protein [Saprospiraceae bacterium]|nr:tetratricopeptide repeat protein [Bacteroidia bacterium]NNL93235.1 tetratricopeptide repeat protein [Saprospiraceae bacterium]